MVGSVLLVVKLDTPPIPVVLVELIDLLMISVANARTANVPAMWRKTAGLNMVGLLLLRLRLPPRLLLRVLQQIPLVLPPVVRLDVSVFVVAKKDTW